ncbi:MAG: GAF domain-containing protein [Elusimicrobiota bacterium]
MPHTIKEKLEQKEKELKILHLVAKYISSNLELTELLQHIVEIATELTAADSCFIYLYDQKKEELVLKASKNPHANELERIILKKGEGVAGWVVEVEKPVVLTKGAYKDIHFKSFSNLPEDKFEAFLSVPILSKDKVVGVINIQHKNEYEYPDDQVGLLFSVAKYLGSSVESAASQEAMQKKIEQLGILSKISETIISESYLKEILHLIVTMTAEMMDSKICSIVLLNEDRQELVIAATQSLSDAYKNKPPLKVGDSVSGKAVREKKPVTVLDVTKDKEYMYPEIARKENIISMLSVPMMIKEKVIGVINSYTEKEHKFSDEEISMLQAVANQSAVAIENTRLNKEIFKAKEELENRKTIDRAKGILMKDMGISKEEAYKKLQKKSMDMRKSMRALAEAVILSSDMRG